MATVTKPLALDESINTTEQTPRNVADVLAQGLDAIEQAIAGGSGSGGHVIEDTNGTTLAQRADLQFVGVYTEDDSANDRTKVNVVRTMTKAQMDALSAAEKVGFIRTSDEADNPYQGSVLSFKQFTFNNVTINNSRDYYDLAISLTADEISKIVFCNATVIASEIDIYQCYWRNTNNGVRVIGKAQTTATYPIIVTIVFRA